MWPSLSRSVFALGVALLAASLLGSTLPTSTAHAQEPTEDAVELPGLVPTGCPSAQTLRARRREAARLFAEGERASSALRVAPAARSFACSYALVPTAQAAFNAGVAFEGLDDVPRARAWYARYLAHTPDADDRDEVAQRIAALDARAEAAEAERAEEARRLAEEARAAAPPVRSPEDASTRGRRSRGPRTPPRQAARSLGTTEWFAIGAGSGGAVALVAGVVVFAVSDAVHADFVTGGRADTTLARRGETLDRAASALWIGGLVLGLAGAGLGLAAWLGEGDDARERAAIVAWAAPRTDGGGELGLAGVF
jgi:hypothetical protein